MKQIRILLPTLLMVVAATLFGSCDATIHEYPEPEPAPEPVLTLRFSFDNALPLYKVIETEQLTRATTATGAMDRRFIVQAFRTDNSRGNSRTAERTPDYTFTYTLPDLGQDATYDVHPDLPAGSYRFMVWEDYVAVGTNAGTFYNADNFEEIILRRSDTGEHQGNTDLRDAFRAVKDTTLLRTSDEVVNIPMERPLAKYEFITTDLDEFLARIMHQIAERETQAQAQAAGSNTASAGEPHSDASGTLADTRAVSLDEYTVRFTYPLYMPCSYNMFTNRPADSWTTVTFEGNIERISDTEARLGFDYVFVNGAEAMATVGLAIYNKEGTQVASVATITIPLLRSHLTTVRGKFLTTTNNGSIGIDPTFDGEFNIRIN